MKPSLVNPPVTRLQKILAAALILNLLVTGYLVKTVWDQQRRIQILERDDSIKQAVNKLDTKVDSLKTRIQGFFH